MNENRKASSDPTSASESRVAVELGETPGTIARVGAYEILGEIGSGGMGRVFLAEQAEPIRRRVALKLMKTSLANKNAVARFAAERQAMARLGHRHVARILDGGTTQDGHPFLVMEYVPGVPITKYCDRESLSLRARLRLFLEVCAGVQHAHLNQILHRDLKPSNILVSTVEGRPSVKIIDFGIAKALDEPLAGSTQLTGHRVLGTPTYMSPEALWGSSIGASPVDARTDVYSIGIVLYELMVGTAPFELQGPLAKALRRISEEEPPKPSRRISSMSTTAASSIAEARKMAPAELSRRLSRDLDWIIQKAVAKDPEKRYSSAAELAAEVERYLRYEPVLASPQTWRYHLGRLVRRHRLAFTAAALALLTLISAIVGTTYGLLRARDEARAARAAQAEEAQAREQAEGVSRFLIELFNVADPEISREKAVTARELLERGSARIRRELTAQPLVRARMMATLGRVHEQLGLHTRAESFLEETLELQEAELGVRHPKVAASLVRLGRLYLQQGRLDKAESTIAEGIDLQQDLLGTEAPELVTSLQSLAAVHTDRGDFARSEEILHRALILAEKGYGGKSAEKAELLWSLGNAYKYQGRHQEAETLFLRALDIQETVLGEDHPSVALTLSSLALVVSGLDDPERTILLNHQALDIYEKVLGEEHPQVSRVLSNLGYGLFRQGRYEEARGYLERAVLIDAEVFTYDHPYVASRLTNLGLVYWKLGRHSEAEPLFKRATAIRERVLSPSHPHRATSLWGLANVYRDQRRFSEAEELYREALELRENALPPGDPELNDALREYAVLLRRVGRPDQAAQLEARIVR